MTIHATHYEFLREQVRDGDTLAPIAKGIYGAALALGVMGPYGHTGIIRRITVDGVERVMVIEENPGGGRYTPLSHYKGTDLDIFRAPGEVDGRAASSHAVQMLDGLADYDFKDIWRLFRWGLVRAAARLFDDPMPKVVERDVSDGSKGVICSALVTAAYKRAGWIPPGPSPWPSALCENLGPVAISYRPGVQA
jgi:hypothetical protein